MDWRERWEWIGIVAGGTGGWLVRRWLRRADHRTVSRIADALNAKAQLEICEAEREYLRRALQEILEAAGWTHPPGSQPAGDRLGTRPPPSSPSSD